MDYSRASDIRKTGLSKLITDRLVSNQPVGKSIGRSVSETIRAKGTGIKEFFDPMNMVKAATGGSSLATAIFGRITGRSKEDIKYFTGRGGHSSKPVSSTKGVRTSVALTGTELFDPSIQTLNKIFNFMQQKRESDSEYLQTMLDYEQFNENLRQDRHDEVMEAFLEATEAKRKADAQIKKEFEKREAQYKKEIEGLKKETEVSTQQKPQVDTKKTAQQNKTEAKKSADGKRQAETKQKTEQKKNEDSAKTDKSKETAQKQKSEATGKKADQVRKQTQRKTAEAERPPTGGKASTAAKVATGVATAGAAGSVLAKIKKHEGYQQNAYYDPKKDSAGRVVEEFYSVGYGHQITKKEVQQGYIQIGERRLPVVGNLGKGTVISQKDAEELASQDFKKYEDAARKITNFDKLNEGAQAALIDMTYNMGVGWFSPQTWPSLHKALLNLDMESASKSVIDSKYYRDTGKRAQENALLLKNGLQDINNNTKAATQEPAKNVGQIIDDASVDNAEMKKLMRQQGTAVQQIILNKNENNIVKKQTTPPPSPKEKHPLLN